MLQPCPNDGTMGPISSCRSLEFTIAFESYILSLLPAALLLVCAALRLWTLRSTPFALPSLTKSSRAAKTYYFLKIITAAGLVATNPASLVLYVRKHRSDVAADSLISATTMGFVSSLAAFLLSHFEHFRTTQASLLLPFYLLSTILCDAVRIRTFAFTGFLPSGFFAAFCVAFGARCLLFLAENVEKGWIVKEKNESGLPLSTESTASFVSRLFFAWATPLLIKGARTQLTLDNLPPGAK